MKLGIFNKTYDKNWYWLALSGGWARWFMHVWILKRIEEKWIKINEVSGTSMWAIGAALIAIGKSHKEMLDIINKTKFWKLIDIRFGGSLLWWDKVYQFFDDVFGNKKIEECDVPLKIIATDINKWEKYVFNKWYIKDALRASVAVPGLFKPHKYKWNFFVDWWLVDNLPVKELKSKNIIAISANKRGNLWDIISDWNFTIGIKKDVLMRAFMILMKSNEQHSINKALESNKNVIYIESGKNFKFSDFLKREEIVEYGYKLWKKKIK